MKILTVFGTRPEAIKLYPVLIELNMRKIENEICVTSQQKDLLFDTLSSLNIEPKYTLEKSAEINPAQVLGEMIKSLGGVMENGSYSLVLTQGDTASAYAAAVAAFNLKIPIGHIEAGLRTYDIYSPFPEEFYRVSIGKMAAYHFAPTKEAVKNLVSEGVRKEKIFFVGNTVYDTLDKIDSSSLTKKIADWVSEDRLLVLTTHRREGLSHLKKIYRAVNRITETEQVKILFPCHPNPIIKEAAKAAFSNNERVLILPPLKTADFRYILSHAYAVLTDSGGVEEEAAFYKIPTLVLREKTERTNELKSGALKLVGVEEERIFLETRNLLRKKRLYNKMKKANPDCIFTGASGKICDIIERI